MTSATESISGGRGEEKENLPRTKLKKQKRDLEAKQAKQAKEAKEAKEIDKEDKEIDKEDKERLERSWRTWRARRTANANTDYAAKEIERSVGHLNLGLTSKEQGGK